VEARSDLEDMRAVSNILKELIIETDREKLLKIDEKTL
jgi:hypothetical protein